MNKLFINLVIVAASAVVCSAFLPPVAQCKNRNFEGLQSRINIDPCSSDKCELPQTENVTVAFRFNSDKKVVQLKNFVSANILGISLPFIGTTDTDACGNVRDAETDELAPCPLQAGKEYVYKNTFFVHPLYPRTDLLVHWSLKDGERDVICFEVPAAIVKHKKKKSSTNKT